MKKSIFLLFISLGVLGNDVSAKHHGRHVLTTVTTNVNSNLLVELLKKGATVEEGVKDNLNCLLAWLYARNQQAAADLMNAAKIQLTSENALTALALLDKIERSYRQQPVNSSFGIVSTRSVAAAEQLALLVQVASEVKKTDEVYKAAENLAKTSAFTPQVFQLAQQVQKLLGYDAATGGIYWRDEVVPVLLQNEWNNNLFMAACGGEPLPASWQPVIAWLNEWLERRSLSLNVRGTGGTDNYGFTKPRRAGYRAVAAHPLVLYLLHDRILSSLQTEDTKQFCGWLAKITGEAPERAFSSGLLVLEAAGKSNVKINEHALQGDAFWKGLAVTVLDSIVIYNDTGKNTPRAWAGKRTKLNELYLACNKTKNIVLGQPDMGTLLYQYAYSHMMEAWTSYNKTAADRATRTASNMPPSVPEINSSVKKSRSEIGAVLANPLCAPWLPAVTLLERPASAEAGIIVRWYMTQLSQRDLKQAINDTWFAIAVNNRKLNNPNDQLAGIDDFAGWEALRGAWTQNRPRSNAVLPAVYSPWTDLSEDAVINAYIQKARNWINNTSLKNADVFTAVAVLSWFGSSIDVELLNSLKQAAAAENDPDTKIFWQSCRMHLVVSNVMRGESLETVANDNPLMDAPEITGLSATVGQLKNDSRAWSLRAAVDITWLLSKRVTSLLTPGLSPQDAVTEIRDKQPRENCRNMLKHLDALLQQSIVNIGDGRPQSGLALSLAGMEIELYQAIPETPATARVKQRKDLLAAIALQGIKPVAFCTGFWGIETWLAQWKRELDMLNNKRMLIIQPVAFVWPRLRSSITQNLTVTLNTLEGAIPANGSNLGNWSKYLHKLAGSVTATATPRLSSIPWLTTGTPAGMLQLLTDQCALLEAATRKAEEPVDLDGLNEKYLPSMTWAGGLRNLQIETNELKRIEDGIRQQYNALDMQQSISAMKPLLSAPLVVNLASFREDLLAAVAEVRRAEAGLQAKQFELFSAKLEVKAQELLTKVFSLEKKRTNLLLAITENEAKIAGIGKSISGLQVEMSKLKIDLAGNSQKIKELEEQISQLEKEKKGIEVGMAASVVATLKNQLQLLEDLIYTPTPNPDFKNDRSKDLPGMLGVIAYEAQKQVSNQVDELKRRKGELERQLEEVREASFIKAITTFVGAVVGCIIGGPAGAQLGAMIGQAAGGLIASIKQGKPIGDILKSSINSGIQIAAAAGVDLKAETKSYIADSDLGEMIDNVQKVMGPVLKDMSAFLDKKNLQKAFSFPGAEKSLQQFMGQLRDNVVNALEGQALPEVGGDFVKSLEKVLIHGKPEAIKEKLKDEVYRFLQGLPVNDALKKAALDLGMTVTGTMSEEELKQEMAEKVASLGIFRILPQLSERRDELLQKMMISMTSLQNVLRKANTTDLNTVLASDLFKNSIPVQDYAEELIWMKKALVGVPIAANQEIPWSRLVNKISEALDDLFPNDPERKALLLGQFQAQLDTDGMQAEMQRVLNPWNKELRRRTDEVDKTLSAPCTQDDEEEVLECQISVVDRGVQSLQQNVLNWLKDPGSEEIKDLKKQIGDKIAELTKAENNLKIANLDWKAADLALKKAGFLKTNANLEADITKLGASVSSLAMQQAELLLQNKDIEIRRVKLQAEADLLNELAGNTRTQSLQELQKSATSKVQEAAAQLDAAIAKEKAARNRAIVYGKIESWYTNRTDQEENRPIIELARLLNEHRKHVEKGGVIVRDLLRTLRASKSNYTSFPLPNGQQYWSDYFTSIKQELETRYGRMVFPQPRFIEWDLTQDQLADMFISGQTASSGLQLTIEQFDENKFPSAPVRQNMMNSNIYAIAPASTNERVFFSFIRGEDEEGNEVSNTWGSITIEHDPITPVLIKKNNSYTRDYLLTTGAITGTLSAWDEPVQVKVNRELVYNNIKSITGNLEWAGAISKSFQEQLGMPLTGTYRLKISGRAPHKAKLVFVYISY